MITRKRPEPLEDRILALRAEIEAMIDAKVIELKKTCEGVPIQVLRNLISNRAPNCPCAQALDLLRSDV
jgi:hypothetical protein